MPIGIQIFKIKHNTKQNKMGRHHDKKYGYGASSYGRNGRVHQRMAQRRLAKQGVPAPMAIGLSRYGLAPLGLIGLLGAGVLGYSLLNKRSIGGFGFGRLRNWLPLRTRRGIVTAPGIAPTLASAPIAASVTAGTTIGTGLATGAPIVHNRKVPLKERAISKITGRPVVTNYH